MKMRCFLAALLMCPILATIGSASDSGSIRETLASVPAVEMAAKGAEIVGAANARERSKVTVEVTKTGLSLNPAAAPSLVSAIAKSAPDMASLAAGAAAAAQPKQAVDISKAAAAAAPTNAAQIVAAVCRACPNQYKAVAAAVAQICPETGKEILHTLALVFPELKSEIEAALAGYGTNPPSVAVVLASLKNPSQAPSIGLAADDAAPPTLPTTPATRGPIVAPPYVPYSSSGPNVTPSTSGAVPRGQRNYAAP